MKKNINRGDAVAVAAAVAVSPDSDAGRQNQKA